MDFTNPNYLPRVKITFNPHFSKPFTVYFDFDNMTERAENVLRRHYPSFERDPCGEGVTLEAAIDDMRKQMEEYEVECLGEWIRPEPAFPFMIGGFLTPTFEFHRAFGRLSFTVQEMSAHREEVRNQIKQYCVKHNINWSKKYVQAHLECVHRLSDVLDNAEESLNFSDSHWYGDEDYTEAQQIDQMYKGASQVKGWVMSGLKDYYRGLPHDMTRDFGDQINHCLKDCFEDLIEDLAKSKTITQAETFVLIYRGKIKDLLKIFDVYINKICDAFNPVVNHEKKTIQIPKTLGDLIQLAVELNWDMDHAFDHFFTEEFEKELASFIESKGYSAGSWGGEQ